MQYDNMGINQLIFVINDFPLFLNVLSKSHKYAIMQIRSLPIWHELNALCLRFNLVPIWVVYDK